MNKETEYVKVEEIRPCEEKQEFEVVLLDGNIFPKMSTHYIAKMSSHGGIEGFSKYLMGFHSYSENYKNLVIVTGHKYKYGSYDSPVTGEVIPKEAISHFRPKKNN